MNKKIIVLSGKQYSGKDTVAKILLNKLSGFKRVGIGDAIKLEYSKRTGLSVEEIEKNKANYRPDLINLGNEGRAISDTFWLNALLEIEGNLIIPDKRLKKEYAFFEKHNAFKIRVNSTFENRSKRGTVVKDNDLTETDLDDVKSWDFVIENNSSYEDLVKNTDVLIEKLNNI